MKVPPVGGAPGRDASLQLRRIERLGRDVADQIAAGEVVERPASVVKELVENAIDAGASRVDVEIDAGGMARIVVRDDGSGIHPDDLPLAITRHATSKIRHERDLLDVSTLGFRGEALASIAAVARLTVESRTAGATGVRLISRPGWDPKVEPVAMAPGTRIEVTDLFANVPARKKFVRTEATEVGRCSETLLRLGVAHPDVRLTLAHRGRVLVDLPAASRPDRLLAILARRTPHQPREIRGGGDGIEVVAFLGPAAAALTTRAGLFLVVRRRVVTHRALAKVVEDAYGDALPKGRHPVACVWIEPPVGTVDVNVHPQKAEVRFSDPQRVYAVVRRVLEGAASEPSSVPESPGETGGTGEQGRRARSLEALDVWSRRAEPSPPVRPTGGGAEYRLRTHAAGTGYSDKRREWAVAARELGEGWRPPDASPPLESGPSPPPPDGPEFLTTLPGQVVLFRETAGLLAVDLLAVRTHLLERRLRRELGGGRAESQGLLAPVWIACGADDVRLVSEHAGALSDLGFSIEAFDEASIRVRAVPAALGHCVEREDVAQLVARVVPWLRLRAKNPDLASDTLASALAGVGGPDPTPRLARRWIKELVDDGVDLGSVPGIRRWAARELVP